MLFLQTLRDTVGDDSFFAILREYYATNIYSTVTSQDLLTIAEQVSGMELEPLFNEWIGE
jgi:aminopeptidase N